MVNNWQGDFPNRNRNEDGFERTSPVKAFPPNGYGVYDMIGNVWEWITDWYSSKHQGDAPKTCCVPENPRGGPEEGRAQRRDKSAKHGGAADVMLVVGNPPGLPSRFS